MGADNAGYRKEGTAKGVFVARRFVGFRRKRARRADAAYERQLERGSKGLIPKAQAEEVHFEASTALAVKPASPNSENWKPRRSGRPDEFLPGIILADRGRGKSASSSGTRAAPGGESVRVRTGPHGVFAGQG